MVDFKHIKLLITGSPAAGKSSFCNLLFGSRKFSDEYNSTDIIESKQAFSVVKHWSEERKMTVTVKHFSILGEEGEVVWYELDLEKYIQYFKSLLVYEKFYDQKEPSESSEDNGDGNLSDYNDNDNDDENDPEAPKSDIEKILVEADPISDSFTIDMVKLITVVDTGGQPEYLHLLPAINSYPTFTFIVHDLTKKLDDPVQVRYKKEGCEEIPVQILNLSYLNMIHLLTCFVSDSLEQAPDVTVPYISVPKKPYIGFVGTHYDKVRDDSAILTDINDKLDHIIKGRSLESIGVLPSNKGIIHPVDNTTAGISENEDPEAKLIRSQIECFANSIETKTLPITWMLLQLRIQQLDNSNHKGYITYEEYVMIAEKFFTDKDEINTSLLYFHFIGLLLYFKDPSLCNYIITDLHWLYTNLAKVMHLSSTNINFSDYKLQKIFDDQRLLPKSECVKMQLNNVTSTELDLFLKILVHLKVIASVTVNSTEFLYLPCVLSNLKICSPEHKHSLSESILIQFKSGFLPRGFFCSLVVHLLNEEPEGWKHQLHKSKKNYSDLIIFRLPDSSFLYMYDKIFYLELEVRHSEKDFVPFYHSKLFGVVHQYLESVCGHLCFDSQKLQYGFLCHANESDGDHIAVIDPTKISEFMPAELQCTRKCSRGTKLNKSHKIWFEEVSQFMFGDVYNYNNVQCSVIRLYTASYTCKCNVLYIAINYGTFNTLNSLIPGLFNIRNTYKNKYNC